MKIRLHHKAYEEIISHCKDCFPLEACGLIAGKIAPDGKTVVKAYPLKNMDSSQTHFTIDLREQLQAVLEMRKEGLTPLGNFHSHPETPSRPSEEDLRLSPDPKASYLIVSLAQSEPIVKSFHIYSHEGRLTSSEEEITIENRQDEVTPVK
ncbi:MAG: M67 family metallopeptidase [Deltaproteobacteria bacterium]|jgi:proteasome lid subunit RPN8/RPN11|nr:M67 family metallopeptidase [Deltaproteobacteria bacterium]